MLGVDVFSDSLIPVMGIALIAGVLSFLSPCVLPIVPPYLAYMAGTTIDGVRGDEGPNRKVISAALFFILGLSTVFMILGFTASSIGRLFLQYQGTLAMISGGVIVILGLHFLHVFRIPVLDRDARFETTSEGGTALGAYVMGLAFAFGWTPCIGPVLGMIIALALQDDTVGRGALMMGAYVLGLGLPFLLAAIFMTRFMGAMAHLRKHMGRIEKVTGVMLVSVGVLLGAGVFTRLSGWLVQTFPALGLIG